MNLLHCHRTHNLGLSQEISNHCNTSGGVDAEICKEEEEAAQHSNAHKNRTHFANPSSQAHHQQSCQD
jgi:hypothetical protein